MNPDNKEIVMLPKQLFANLIDMDLQKQIATSIPFDHNAAKAMKTLLQEGPSTLRQDLSDWKIEEFDGKHILFFKGKNYIPKNDILRRDIVRNYYDHLTARHLRELQTFNAVREHYWWPGM